MDSGSQEELRVYLLLQELEDRKYNEYELKKIFGFNCPLNKTRLYKYIHLKQEDFASKLYTILKGELVDGDNVRDRTPIKRGKYKITAVIDDVKFTFVERENDE